ncbi:MAG TPA: response regulator [Stellaceae bacterium]
MRSSHPAARTGGGWRAVPLDWMDRICKILVVEDDDAVRALLGHVLEHQGYDFALASSAAEMRTALETDDYDVAIIDISLRGVENGFALAEVASDKGCGIILTTGDPAQRARLEASGRRHILKPFRILDLTALVDQVLKDTEALCVPRPPDDSAVPAVR